jgi:oxygen-independent coproporphyrinogen-3 oxidase
MEWGDEYVMMGLRISGGISLARYEAITGQTMPRDVIMRMIDTGFLSQDQDRLFTTPRGRTVLNAVSAKLLGA